jgi:Rps23 Pro-64 3,4-dihydroxylase Tpa1-like proline 4-hydroxylase
MSNIPKSAIFSRIQIADAILHRLDENSVLEARRQFAQTPTTQWFSVDNLLPQEMADEIHAAFPQPSQMRERKTLREHKYVAAQMDRYHPQAEEALFAFHDERVVARVGQITQLAKLQADPQLYAGGISLMMQGNFLNPHLDNSHNNDRSLYRVLNLLYYVSPGWNLESGGHLEVWPRGVDHAPQMIPSLFNRLVVMTTGPESWHSVTRVKSTDRRCCVSNYYFSTDPIGNDPYFRVTSFRGRPEQPVRDLVLRADSGLRQAIRKLRPQGVQQTTHLYKKPGNH